MWNVWPLYISCPTKKLKNKERTKQKKNKTKKDRRSLFGLHKESKTNFIYFII